MRDRLVEKLKKHDEKALSQIIEQQSRFVASVIYNTSKGSLSSDTTGSDYDLYVFGYNKKMLPADETVTLFDKVQLKSFIDGEKKDGVTIGVKGYGIQADYLRGTNVDFTKAHYSAADLNEIYSIVRNKAGI
ncbi:MAG: hypothetical protein IJG99_02195 [Ruminococcus sp.]|nr:hypothetical protein [Ruminococcus sp.]